MDGFWITLYKLHAHHHLNVIIICSANLLDLPANFRFKTSAFQGEKGKETLNIRIGKLGRYEVLKVVSTQLETNLELSVRGCANPLSAFQFLRHEFKILITGDVIPKRRVSHFRDELLRRYTNLQKKRENILDTGAHQIHQDTAKITK